ncbi:phage tail protein [Candidatus Symbiopectobacterium sp. 'North America']|uniref:phage tail assembly protein n=1 Tax=Candidatus Symbiopectobacterium sp. 'North America' TaxID=2794574 RepID=UPI0018CA0CC1|nr:phage tail assembly protein [Candidatus Symbiopectobacterium sp. 'North America']MBG6245417.1 phage tail protein [Candidatus Symbiopectobacterium sp. 'North America']
MSKKNDNVLTLITPIVRDADKITRVAITDEIKQAGSLRVLRLVNVLNMDANSVTTLLTRVTSPKLKLAEINAMDTRDFVRLAEALTPFLAPVEPGELNEVETETA